MTWTAASIFILHKLREILATLDTPDADDPIRNFAAGLILSNLCDTLGETLGDYDNRRPENIELRRTARIAAISHLKTVVDAFPDLYLPRSSLILAYDALSGGVLNSEVTEHIVKAAKMRPDLTVPLHGAIKQLVGDPHFLVYLKGQEAAFYNLLGSCEGDAYELLGRIRAIAVADRARLETNYYRLIVQDGFVTDSEMNALEEAKAIESELSRGYSSSTRKLNAKSANSE